MPNKDDYKGILQKVQGEGLRKRTVSWNVMKISAWICLRLFLQGVASFWG